MGTKVGVFIIESRKIIEERKGKRQGLILTEMMTLLGIKFEYRYIRTTKELNEMVKQYYDSKFRYLHLSMHGVISRNRKPVSKFSLSLEQVSYDAFGKIIIKKWDDGGLKRRLFISACHVVDNITTQFENKRNSFISIVAPSVNIKTKVAPLAWATFYNNMFAIEKESMANNDIKENLNRICGFFNVKFKGYFRKGGGSSQYAVYFFPRQKK